MFELTEQGLKLIEIAAGLDLERDILANMDFKPLIAEELKVMDKAIYLQQWGGLAHEIRSEYRL